MKQWFVIVALAVSCAFGGCRTQTTVASEPDDLMHRYCVAIVNNDADEQWRLLSPEVKAANRLNHADFRDRVRAVPAVEASFKRWSSNDAWIYYSVVVTHARGDTTYGRARVTRHQGEWIIDRLGPGGE
jgi:hypothetical protein